MEVKPYQPHGPVMGMEVWGNVLGQCLAGSFSRALWTAGRFGGRFYSSSHLLPACPDLIGCGKKALCKAWKQALTALSVVACGLTPPWSELSFFFLVSFTLFFSFFCCFLFFPSNSNSSIQAPALQTERMANATIASLASPKIGVYLFCSLAFLLEKMQKCLPYTFSIHA